MYLFKMSKKYLIQSLKEKGFPKKILNAFEKVSREEFISTVLKDSAYEDTALPIGQGQTISQPYTIAVMLDLLNLKSGQKVLELGSGSGYVLALLSNIVGGEGKVFGVEIVKELAENSEARLSETENIKIYNKHGNEGLPEEAPFDRILISAAIEKVPNTILSQLKPNGLLVAPVGIYGADQTLTAIQRKGSKFVKKEKRHGFVFVRFID